MVAKEGSRVRCCSLFSFDRGHWHTMDYASWLRDFCSQIFVSGSCEGGNSLYKHLLGKKVFVLFLRGVALNTG